MGLRNSNSNDLIGKLGAMKASNSNGVSTEASVNTDASQTDKAGNKSTSAATGETNSVETKGTVSSEKESSENSSVVKDPDSWSKESALLEVKKLREENKATRLKYEESLEQLKADMEARIKAREEKERELVEYKKQLEEIKTKEEDKKRDLTEKLSHREALLAEMKIKQEALEKAFQSQLQEKEMILKKYEAEISAQTEVYKQRLDSELNGIPEKYKEIASLIVKGAGDPRDALVALSEAKIKGVFEDKTVVVNHSVPGANDGARVTQDKLNAVERERREKMNSSSLIGEALKSIRSGNPNSAFRSNK